MKNHYGVWVDEKTPITGVISSHNVEWIHNEVYDSIDLLLESHIAECNDCLNDLDCDILEYWELDGDNTILIGKWFKNNDGLYEPDSEGEYSALWSGNIIQVVHSKFVSRNTLCSPCYPGQADIPSNGDYLSFDLPPDLYGEWLNHDIFELEAKV